jgi:hypothetical protein
MAKYSDGCYDKERHCRVCGKNFRPLKTNIVKGNGLHCSNRCGQIGRSSFKDYSYLDLLSETDWAYIAGIIDGEGAIWFRTDFKGICLSIGNTDKPLMNWLRGKLGGKIYLPKITPRRKQGFMLSYSTVPAYRILERALPYLITKKERATMLMEFATKRLIMSTEEKLVLLEKFKLLNHRGV